MQATCVCMEAQLLGVVLPQLSHNILTVYLSILMILIPEIMNPFHWCFYLILLSVPPWIDRPYQSTQLRTTVHGYAFDSDNLNFPCLVPHGACLLHHYCRADQFSAGLLLASLVWSTLEPRYRIPRSRLKIYGSFSFMFKSASIAREFHGTEKLVCEHNSSLQLSPYSVVPTEFSRAVFPIVAQIWLQTRSNNREGRSLLTLTWLGRIANGSRQQPCISSECANWPRSSMPWGL